MVASAGVLLATLILGMWNVQGCAASRGGKSGQTIRVMTWNIHHGEGLDGTIDVDRIAKLILKENVDIVAVQEIDRGVERSERIDIITSLADLTDMTYAFGKTIDYQGGTYGNGFLTRFPILEESNTLYRETRGREPRGLLMLIVEYKGEEIVVANTHFDSSSDDTIRAEHALELSGLLRRFESRPTILFGDLNDLPQSKTLEILKNGFSDAWEAVGLGNGFTYPAHEPGKRIDYVLFRTNPKPDSVSAPLRLRPAVARVVRSAASDHLPVIVDFTFSTEH